MSSPAPRTSQRKRRNTGGERRLLECPALEQWPSAQRKQTTPEGANRMTSLDDPELLYMGACPTTSGLVEGHRSEHDRFEVDGANAARDVLREHGNALRTVRDAIALHRAQTRTIAGGDQALATRLRRPRP